MKHRQREGRGSRTGENQGLKPPRSQNIGEKASSQHHNTQAKNAPASDEQTARPNEPMQVTIGGLRPIARGDDRCEGVKSGQHHHGHNARRRNGAGVAGQPLGSEGMGDDQTCDERKTDTGKACAGEQRYLGQNLLHAVYRAGLLPKP